MDWSKKQSAQHKLYLQKQHIVSSKRYVLRAAATQPDDVLPAGGGTLERYA